MNTSITNLPNSSSVAERALSGLPLETRQLVSLGRRRLWPFQVLGKAPMLQEPVRLGDWLLVPAQDDPTAIPERALARIRAIFAAGIRPQGFVLIHEAPMLLKGPSKPPESPAVVLPAFSATAPLPETIVSLASALGAGLAGLASMIFPMLLFVATAMVDPILVAVTEDGFWVEIDRWYAE
jgi:hypothetical protein